MNAPANIIPELDHTEILFEDEDLHPAAYTPFTWRAHISYADPSDFTVCEIELQDYRSGWVPLAKTSFLYAALSDRTFELRSFVSAHITAAMDAEREQDRAYRGERV